MRLQASVCGVLVALVFGRSARAQETASEAEALGVDYAAPDGCPGGATFFAEVTARTPRARAARAGERARVLHVRLTRSGDGHTGTLAIEDTSGTGSAREVTGGTCAEVVGALALVAALAVDPRASMAPRPPPVAAATQAPEPVAPESVPPVTPTAEVVGAAKVSETSEEPRRAWFALGAAGEVAMISGAVGSLRAFVDLEVSRGAADRALFAPAFRLAVARSLDRDVDTSIAPATLRWTQAALDVCPMRFALGGGVALRPCASAAGGMLEAESIRDRTRPWASPGAHGRLVWAPGSLLALEAEAGLVAPLYRELFFLEPNTPVYEAPAAAFVGRFGVSLRFP